MKNVLLPIFFITLLISSCKDENNPVAPEKKVTYVTCLGDGTEAVAEDEIAVLIMNVLAWSDSKDGIDLLPVLISEKDTLHSGFDMIQLSKNSLVLEKTGFFTKKFIDNYTLIIKTLDRKIQDKTFEAWYVGELPTFRFNNGANAWCNCQDNLAWDEVETEVIQLDDRKGELYWKFGGIKPGDDPGWKEFRYKFKVAKQSGKWKIDWMEGFDYETSIKKDGL